jgi:hypothetical protein
LAAVPHLCLPIISADFLVDKGCFFLPLFWALSMPIGIALAQGRWLRPTVLFGAAGLVVVMQAAWILPSQQLAMRRSEVGAALRARFGQEVKVIGDWGTALPVVVSIAGWDYERVASHYYDRSFPGPGDFAATGEDSLLIIVGKKPWLRRQLGKLPFPGLEAVEWTPPTLADGTQLQQVLDSEHLSVYLWTRGH